MKGIFGARVHGTMILIEKCEKLIAAGDESMKPRLDRLKDLRQRLLDDLKGMSAKRN